MACSITIQINDTSNYTATDRAVLRVPETTNRPLELNRLQDYLSYLNSGNGQGSLKIDISSGALAQASGTVTCASVLAADTVTINGVVFTAVNGSPTGDQFDMSLASDTLVAADLVRSFNASTTANTNLVATASSALGVVTFKSNIWGLIGNLQTIASSNSTRLLTSGVRMTGGTGGSSATGFTSYSVG